MPDHPDNTQPTPSEDPAWEPSADPVGEPMPLVELETLLTRPPSWRKRLAQLGLLLVVAALALAALRGALPPSGLPSNASAPAQVSATLLSNVNFGTLTVNGSKLDQPPPLTIPLPVKGATIITLNARPFQPHTCRFTDLTSPMDDPDHCLLDYADTPVSTTSGTHPGGFTVGIFLLPDDLPADQRSQALAAMIQPLGAPQQTTVHPGEYFATSFRYEDQITSQRATGPLVAHASFEPSQVPGPMLAPGCSGGGICPQEVAPDTLSGLPTHAWGLYVTEALHWQFSDAGGATRADVSIPSVNIISMLLANETTGWQIANFAVFIGNRLAPVCQAGVAMMQFRLSGEVTLLHDQGVEGCELRVQVNGVDEGRYVWRFGVLLAADTTAHAVSPDLPIASPEEIAAVGG